VDRRDKVVATPVVLPYSGWPGVVELREILVVVEDGRRAIVDRRDKVVATPVVLPYSGWPGVVELREILVVVETDRRRVGHPAIVQALHSEHMQQ
jgi:hypothetical protein